MDRESECYVCGTKSVSDEHMTRCDAASSTFLNTVRAGLSEDACVEDNGAGPSLLLLGNEDEEVWVFPNPLEGGGRLAYQVENIHSGYLYEAMPFTLQSNPDDVSYWLTERRRTATPK